MGNELVSEPNPIFFGPDPQQILLDLLGRALARETEPPREPMDVGIDDESGPNAEGRAEHDVGGLPGDAREREQILHRPGHLAAVLGQQARAGAPNILGFRVEKARRANVGLELARRRVRDRARVGEAREEARSDPIHALVGALGREDRRDEQLEGVAVAERAVGRGVGLTERAGDLPSPGEPVFASLPALGGLAGSVFAGHGARRLAKPRRRESPRLPPARGCGTRIEASEISKSAWVHVYFVSLHGYPDGYMVSKSDSPKLSHHPRNPVVQRTSSRPGARKAQPQSARSQSGNRAPEPAASKGARSNRRVAANSLPVARPLAAPWTLVRLDEELRVVGDTDPKALDELIDRMNGDGAEIALGLEEPPEEPRGARPSRPGETRDDSSDPLAILFREAQRRPRPTRDEERRLFRRVVFARRRLERTLGDLQYPKEAYVAFLRNSPCVAFQPSSLGANAAPCVPDGDAPCVKFFGLCGNAIVHQRCCAYHEARNAFVVRYLYLVLGMVRRYRDRGIDTADLVQEGSAALLRAAEDFEPERGFRFSTYARWWVNQAFLRTMYNNLRTVRLPVYLQKAAAKVMRHAGDRDFRDLDFGELAKKSGVAESTIRILAEFSRSTVSIDAATGERESAMTIADPRAEFRPEALDKTNVRGEVEKAMSVLDSRERTILRLRFGLDSRFPRTLEEVGEQLSLSRERVRQIQEEALAKLRNPLHLERLRDLVDVD